MDKEICHLLQNSLTEAAKYGLLKFCISLISNSFAVPIAISEYPEKIAVNLYRKEKGCKQHGKARIVLRRVKNQIHIYCKIISDHKLLKKPPPSASVHILHLPGERYVPP